MKHDRRYLLLYAHGEYDKGVGGEESAQSIRDFEIQRLDGHDNVA